MGRTKLKMEVIEKEKLRNATFKRRKEGLVRKMHEFTTLCDVNACMIIYGPKQENSTVEPEIWPPKPDEVRRMISLYKAKKKEDSVNKTFGLNDFFQERKKKVEEELSMLRKKNMEAKYPTSLDHNMKNMTQGQLRQFADELRNKSENLKFYIQILKRYSTIDDPVQYVEPPNGQFYPPLPPATIDQNYQFGGGANFLGETASSPEMDLSTWWESLINLDEGIDLDQFWKSLD